MALVIVQSAAWLRFESAFRGTPLTQQEAALCAQQRIAEEGALVLVHRHTARELGVRDADGLSLTPEPPADPILIAPGHAALVEPQPGCETWMLMEVTP